jgi:hypothetical protein
MISEFDIWPKYYLLINYLFDFGEEEGRKNKERRKENRRRLASGILVRAGMIYLETPNFVIIRKFVQIGTSCHN